MKDRRQQHLLLISGLVLLLASPIASCTTGNTSPPTPSCPSGPGSGDSGMPCAYSSSSIDPDNDQVKYIFDWGDGSTSETRFLPSGTTGTSSHVWNSPGTYYVRAKAVDSNGTSSGWSDAATVIISAMPTMDLSAPVRLIGPPNGAVLASNSRYCYNERFVLEWEQQWTACEYEFDISLDQSFTQIVLDETSWPAGTGGFCVPCNPSSPAVVIQQGALDCGTIYYWRVKSHCTQTGNTIASSWSATWVFTIAAHPGSPLTLLAPDDGATNVPLSGVDFTWTDVDDADGYDFVLSTNADLSSPLASESGLSGTAYTYTGKLDYTTTYFWQVTALKDGSVFAQSDIGTFSTMAEPGVPPDSSE